MELDDKARVISYEEYHPYGTTAFQAKNADIKSAAKRYRYTGMERDEESGLEYHGARYYLPWLGRWANSDPIGLKDGTNLYLYAIGNPIHFNDPNGKESNDTLSFSSSFQKTLEEADRENYSDESINHLLDIVDQEISKRGFSYVLYKRCDTSPLFDSIRSIF